METVELAYDVFETPETRQDKCPIILIHGLFWNKYMYKDLAKALCETTRRKVFCVDLRCHDESPFSEECGPLFGAEDIKRFIMDRNLKKVILVTHSLSSAISNFVAIHEPELVEKMVMIDHGPFINSSKDFFDENALRQFQQQNRFLNILHPSLSLSEAKQKILNFSKVATTVAQKIFLQKVAYELIKVNNKFGWKTDHQFLLDRCCDEQPEVNPEGPFDHEILIIRCPDSGYVTDETFARTLKYYPNAKLVTIPDTTHLLMFEKQEEFLKLVKDFLD